MNRDDKRRATFPLRLALSLRDAAHCLAHQEGISLNHFVSIAVAEKISRLEHETLSLQDAVLEQQKLAMAAGVIKKRFYDHTN